MTTEEYIEAINAADSDHDVLIIWNEVSQQDLTVVVAVHGAVGKRLVKALDAVPNTGTVTTQGA